MHGGNNDANGTKPKRVVGWTGNPLGAFFPNAKSRVVRTTRIYNYCHHCPFITRIKNDRRFRLVAVISGRKHAVCSYIKAGLLYSTRKTVRVKSARRRVSKRNIGFLFFIVRRENVGQGK